MLTALATLVGAISGGVTVLFVKGRLGDVIASRADQDRTAVDAMVAILNKTTDGLISSLATVEKLSSSVQVLASGVKGHEKDEGLRFDYLRTELGQINATLNDEIRPAVIELRADHNKLVTALSGAWDERHRGGDKD